MCVVARRVSHIGGSTRILTRVAPRPPDNAYPECWLELIGCGNHTIEAVTKWLNVGGRRLDAADSYDTQTSVGIAMARSSVPRSEMFVLQKTGSWNPMGAFLSLSLSLLIWARTPAHVSLQIASNWHGEP